MFNSRRFFLKTSGLGALSMLYHANVWSKNLEEALHQKKERDAEELASDEDFWYYVQQAYTTSSGLINLNNGGVSPSPKSCRML